MAMSKREAEHEWRGIESRETSSEITASTLRADGAHLHSPGPDVRPSIEVRGDASALG